MGLEMGRGGRHGGKMRHVIPSCSVLCSQNCVGNYSICACGLLFYTFLTGSKGGKETEKG